MRKRLTPKMIVVAAALAAVAITGGAFAATKATSPKEESQAVINDAAQQLGVQPNELTAALKKALSNRIGQAVKDGRITKAQGDELKARINSGDFPLFGGPHRGFGFRGHGGPHFHLHGLDAAASYLGLTEAQLRTKLSGGKSLAQVAKEQNKSVSGLVDALVKAQNEKLDQAVKDGRLTQAQANEIKQGQRERITEFVNNGRLRFKFRDHRGDGPGRAFRFPDGAPPGLGAQAPPQLPPTF